MQKNCLHYTISEHTYHRFKQRLPHIAKDKKSIRRFILKALKNQPRYSFMNDRIPEKRKVKFKGVTIVLSRNTVVTVY